MDDLISRQAAISHVDDMPYIKDHPNVGLLWKAWIESLPSAQETHEERTETHACDLISRQAAIAAINKAFERVFAWDGTSPLGDKVLENVPSAQPEQRWIPCSERLPEDGNYVLITTFGKVVASYFDEKVDVWRSEGAIYGTRTVQAWMPFPNPYKERNG